MPIAPLRISQKRRDTSSSSSNQNVKSFVWSSFRRPPLFPPNSLAQDGPPAFQSTAWRRAKLQIEVVSANRLPARRALLKTSPLRNLEVLDCDRGPAAPNPSHSYRGLQEKSLSRPQLCLTGSLLQCPRMRNLFPHTYAQFP